MSAIAIAPLAAAPSGVEPTLDDVIVGLWTRLSGHETVRCPVCEGEMMPEYGPHTRPVAGRCRVCGSAIS